MELVSRCLDWLEIEDRCLMFAGDADEGFGQLYRVVPQGIAVVHDVSGDDPDTASDHLLAIVRNRGDLPFWPDRRVSGGIAIDNGKVELILAQILDHFADVVLVPEIV